MLITLGPVQSFISQSRKAQDLWSGSYFLSYLINEGKKSLTEDCDLIFPAKETKLDAQVASLPNRLLFVADDPKATAERVEAAIQAALKEVVNYSLSKLVAYGSLEESTLTSSANFLELFWGAVEYDEAKDSYSEKYGRLESLVGSSKNYRPFAQNEYPDSHNYPIIICPLCGERHGIALEKKLSSHEVRLLWNRISGRNPKIKANEYFCPVCLAKRWFPDFLYSQNKVEISFPSTADVAVTEWRDDAHNSKFIEELEASFQTCKYLKNDRGYTLPKLRKKFADRTFTDAHWYFPENFSKREFAKLRVEPSRRNATDYEDFNQEREAFLKLKPKSSPNTSYYGMMMMDGDSMGEMLSKVQNATDHKNFSKALNTFSSVFVPHIVEQNYLGKLVYAGGDDLFALTAKNDLLNSMNEVRLKFKELLTERQSEYKTITGNYTMSAGAVVAHYKAPLFYVLDQAREMEKRAKSFQNGVDKKNACALMMLSHTGNNKYTLFPWEYNDDRGAVLSSVDLLNKFKDDLTKGVISKTCIYKLKEEFEPLLNADGLLITNENIFQTEFRRIFMRALIDKSKKQEMERRQEELLLFWNHAMSKNVLNFVAFMEIAAVFNRRNV